MKMTKQITANVVVDYGDEDHTDAEVLQLIRGELEGMLPGFNGDSVTLNQNMHLAASDAAVAQFSFGE